MHASINPPSLSVYDINYQSECQSSIELPVRKLVTLAVKAGWNRRHTLLAVMMLASEMIDEDARAH